MNPPHVFPGTRELAEAAVIKSIEILRSSIEAHDVAVWVLAGGSTPLLAYRLIAEGYLDALDWSRVTILLGDERIGPLDSPDNNWHAIEQALLHHIPQATLIRPQTSVDAEQAATDYEKLLQILPQVRPGIPRFDLVWLGVGEDGHTLSLFPEHSSLEPTSQLVITVHNSPKPPANRISLTLNALSGAEHTLILTSGTSKAAILKRALDPSSPLPITRAAIATNAQWYVDQAALPSTGHND